ncbi:MAG: isopentenyl-diphosphate delta-isomerase [Crocinitomicaceae bacterium]|nr:isopentenyl-diphosphate delta-isomerase [Crocinitomicaceae bacterium]|tara:strand:+ start:449 stop:985 length:537 start_codon:yes stop_codon:yes gene_type:complete
MSGDKNEYLEEVILVDKNDVECGTMQKMEVHKNGGALHRAFSVFIFNTKGELLLQKRAEHKYHSGGLWTNTCCSHPRPGETTREAGNRRLVEEMGMDCKLIELFRFEYKAELNQGMTEWELDHVLLGLSDKVPQINKDEVAEYKYMSLDEIDHDLKINPQNYSEWFKICFERVKLEKR